MNRHRTAHTGLAVFSVHALVFAGLTWWSWGKGPDPIIDFGRELYVPWQITQGKVLYRDIASLFGPLSPYVNALWFRLFGVSLMTLRLCNLAIFAATLAGIYHLIRESTDRFVAAFVTISVMLVFGFSQFLEIANYNYVTPYSHEATHGLALSVAALAALLHGYTSRRILWFSVAGLCFGGVVLTKPETTLAAAAAVSIGFAVLCLRRQSPGTSIAALAAFLAGTTVLPAAFVLFFERYMPASDAIRGVFAAYTAAAGHGVFENAFYRRVMGLDAPLVNGLRMIAMFVAFAAFIAAGVWIARRIASASPSRARTWKVARLTVFVLVGGLVPFGMFFTALPLICLAALAIWTGIYAREQRAGRSVESAKAFSMLTWSTFAVVLLAKMALEVRLSHYGFFLALPAFSVTLVLLAFVVPDWLRKTNPVAAREFRVLAGWATAGVVVPLLLLSQWWYAGKTVAIGSGPDRFYATGARPYGQGEAISKALVEIGHVSPPGSQMAVLPEGVMFNYLLRRESPLRVVNVMPPEVLVFGEAEVLRSLQAAPPPIVVLIQRHVTEYGYPAFGADPRYGRSIVSWVHAHYELIRKIGWDSDDRVSPGIELFRRRDGGG
jgi:Dolichyl-phosphate-mannose-protein mannosyltransferase